jgi:hypothetical protein
MAERSQTTPRLLLFEPGRLRLRQVHDDETVDHVVAVGQRREFQFLHRDNPLQAGRANLTVERLDFSHAARDHMDEGVATLAQLGGDLSGPGIAATEHHHEPAGQFTDCSRRVRGGGGHCRQSQRQSNHRQPLSNHSQQVFHGIP